jgi:hypothetical protein
VVTLAATVATAQQVLLPVAVLLELGVVVQLMVHLVVLGVLEVLVVAAMVPLRRTLMAVMAAPTKEAVVGALVNLWLEVIGEVMAVLELSL